MTGAPKAPSGALAHLISEAVRPLVSYGAPEPTAGIKLDANESPWPVSAQTKERLKTLLGQTDFHRYPDPEQRDLKQALVSVHGGAAADYIVGSGSDEVIALLASALSAPRGGRRHAAVLYPAPTFVMFEMTSRVHGLEPVAVPLDAEWQLDVPAMLKAIGVNQPNLVFLATPNNPTGNRFQSAALRTLIEADPAALFVIDEAYAAYSGQSQRALADAYPNVAMMGTISKIGFAAARVGWARLPAGLAAEVNKARQPYNLNGLSAAVACAVLGPLKAEVEAQVASVIAERSRLAAALAALGVRVFPSDANFLLTKPTDGAALTRALAARAISVKSYSAGPLASHVRITVGTPAENDALLAALKGAGA
jgi:histidinol-phosphate aminotransferase